MSFCHEKAANLKEWQERYKYWWHCSPSWVCVFWLITDAFTGIQLDVAEHVVVEGTNRLTKHFCLCIQCCTCSMCAGIFYHD